MNFSVCLNLYVAVTFTQGSHTVLITTICPCFEGLSFVKFCCPYFCLSLFRLASIFLSYFLVSNAFVEGMLSVISKQ